MELLSCYKLVELFTVALLLTCLSSQQKFTEAAEPPKVTASFYFHKGKGSELNSVIFEKTDADVTLKHLFTSHHVLLECNAAYPIEWISPRNKYFHAYTETRRHVEKFENPNSYRYTAILELSPDSTYANEVRSNVPAPIHLTCRSTLMDQPLKAYAYMAVYNESPPKYSLQLTSEYKKEFLEPAGARKCEGGSVAVPQSLYRHPSCWRCEFDDEIHRKPFDYIKRCSYNVNITKCEASLDKLVTLPKHVSVNSCFEKVTKAGKECKSVPAGNKMVPDMEFCFKTGSFPSSTGDRNVPELYFNWAHVDPSQMVFIHPLERKEVYVGEEVTVKCEFSMFYFSLGSWFAVKNPSGNMEYIKGFERKFCGVWAKVLDWKNGNEFKPENSKLSVGCETEIKHTYHNHRTFTSTFRKRFSAAGRYEVFCMAPVYNSSQWVDKSVSIVVAELPSQPSPLVEIKSFGDEKLMEKAKSSNSNAKFVLECRAEYPIEWIFHRSQKADATQPKVIQAETRREAAKFDDPSSYSYTASATVEYSGKATDLSHFTCSWIMAKAPKMQTHVLVKEVENGASLQLEVSKSSVRKRRSPKGQNPFGVLGTLGGLASTAAPGMADSVKFDLGLGALEVGNQGINVKIGGSTAKPGMGDPLKLDTPLGVAEVGNGAFNFQLGATRAPIGAGNTLKVDTPVGTVEIGNTAKNSETPSKPIPYRIIATECPVNLSYNAEIDKHRICWTCNSAETSVQILTCRTPIQCNSLPTGGAKATNCLNSVDWSTCSSYSSKPNDANYCSKGPQEDKRIGGVYSKQGCPLKESIGNFELTPKFGQCVDENKQVVASGLLSFGIPRGAPEADDDISKMLQSPPTYANWRVPDHSEMLYLHPLKADITPEETVEIKCEYSRLLFSLGSWLGVKDAAGKFEYISALDKRPCDTEAERQQATRESSETSCDPSEDAAQRGTFTATFKKSFAAGSYQIFCFGPEWNSTSWVNATGSITVAKRELPKVLSISPVGDQALYFGETNRTLECKFEGNPPPTVRWVIPGEGEPKTVTGNGSSILIIEEVNNSTAGNYSCHVESAENSDYLQFSVEPEASGELSGAEVAAITVGSVGTAGGLVALIIKFWGTISDTLVEKITSLRQYCECCGCGGEDMISSEAIVDRARQFSEAKIKGLADGAQEAITERVEQKLTAVQEFANAKMKGFPEMISLENVEERLKEAGRRLTGAEEEGPTEEVQEAPEEAPSEVAEEQSDAEEPEEEEDPEETCSEISEEEEDVEESENDEGEEAGNVEEEETDNVEESDELPCDEKFEIPLDRLIIDYSAVLGSGEFGKILKGKLLPKKTVGYDNLAVELTPDEDAVTMVKGWDESKVPPTGLDVAVKLCNRKLGAESFKAFLSEMKVMSYMGKHRNIVSLIGASTGNIAYGNREIYIAEELCHNGSLDNFVRKNKQKFVNKVKSGRYQHNLQTTVATRPTSKNKSSGKAHSDLQKEFSTAELIRWTSEIAAGLEYIHRKRVIHGNLSLRNVLLTEKFVAKIGNFGLSRRLGKKSVYAKPKQRSLTGWRNMAAESLQPLQVSVKSDVWSLGVTLWELYTLGNLPYEGRNYTPDLVKEIASGSVRLSKPVYAPDNIYNFMEMCWKSVPEARPSPVEIRAICNELLHKSPSRTKQPTSTSSKKAVAKKLKQKQTSNPMKK